MFNLFNKKKEKNDILKHVAARDFKVIIVGTGISGLCAGIKLKELGIPFIIFEKSDQVGGTWYDNTYPGCCCDIPASLYSFSFNPNPNWSSLYPPQAEILKYLEETAQKFGLYEHIKFGHEVKRLVFNQDKSAWQIDVNPESSKENITAKQYEADFLIAGFGGLNYPSIPIFSGIENFKGEAFHTRQWKPNFDWKNKNIIVIGNAASAIQVIPFLANGSKKLIVFQRTPNWVAKRMDTPIPSWIKKMFATFPFTQRLFRSYEYTFQELGYFMIFKFKASKSFKTKLVTRIKETFKAKEELISEMIPSYEIGCKRILIADDYYETFLRDNVELATNAIQKIEEHAVIDVTGKQYPADAIIYATGFIPQGMHPDVFGIDKSRELYKDIWGKNPEAYLGITVPGFPNFGMITGPNTGLGHNSIILMIEWQCEYILKMIKYLLMNNLKSIDVRTDVYREYNDILQKDLSKSVWARENCHSWYQNDKGKITILWKGSTISYKRALSKFNPKDYLFKK